MTTPRRLPKAGKHIARHYCIIYPDGSVMNADGAPTARGRATPALYATRREAWSGIRQRKLPDGMRVGKIRTEAVWRVIK